MIVGKSLLAAVFFGAVCMPSDALLKRGEIAQSYTKSEQSKLKSLKQENSLRHS